MRFALFANPRRDPGFKIRTALAECLADLGGESTHDPKDFPHCDILICLGGDGSFLSLIHHFGPKLPPAIGLNLGSVGFLMHMRLKQMRHDAERLMHGDYLIEERMLLSVKFCKRDGSVLKEGRALNDLVLMRKGEAQLIDINLAIDASDVERIVADGLIVSSPTGSTAYSLAAGGPIVHPSMDLLLITPICPHSLHNRSYVAPGNFPITLSLNSAWDLASVQLDGRSYASEGCHHLRIQRALEPFRMIRFGGDKYFQSLPQKIQQRGMNR